MITFGPIETAPSGQSVRRRYLVDDVPVLLNGRVLIVLPRGRVFDGMSFPWFVSPTWDDPWHERYVGPSMLHDELIRLAKKGVVLPGRTEVMKKWEIDLLFGYALRSNGVSALEAWLFVNAVRTRRL